MNEHLNKKQKNLKTNFANVNGLIEREKKGTEPIKFKNCNQKLYFKYINFN